MTTADTLDTQDPEIEQPQSGAAAETPETPDSTAAGAQPDDATIVDGGSDEGGEESELTLQFGDEAPPASEDQELKTAPQWVKDLRKADREKARRIRELEAQVRTQQAPQATQVPTLGAKPKLEDFDYDETKYDAALEKWYDDKRKVDKAKEEVEAQERARQEAGQAKLNSYIGEAKELRVKDFQDVESEVVSALSVEQQGILLAGADKPALLVYALGRNPAKLKSLASINDPVRFAFAAAKLESQLKTSRTAAKPAPESRVSASGGAPVSGGSQKTLERLREEAARTGDMTKVIAYKRQLKEAAQKR
jgi:hypothetical protein